MLVFIISQVFTTIKKYVRSRLANRSNGGKEVLS